MHEPRDRLREARAGAGFATPSEAARAINDINLSTLSSNENGHRAISKKMAAIYARAFKVDAGWLLYGDAGDCPPGCYSKESLVNVARRLSAAGVLPPIEDDSETVVRAFIQICDEESQKLAQKSQPEDLLKMRPEKA